jgi:hypothetical protein
MPIAVPPWVHRIMIREHGPTGPTIKLCLFMVNCHINAKDDSTFVSQGTISNETDLALSTVQRDIARAIDTGWLVAELTNIRGRKWKSYVYRVSIPDNLEYCDTMQDEGILKAMIPYHAENEALLHGSRPFKGIGGETKGNGTGKARRSRPMGIRAQTHHIATPDPCNGADVTHVVDIKSLSEVPKSSYKNEARIASDARPVSIVDKTKKIQIAIRTWASLSDIEIAKRTQTTAAEVRQVRTQP